MKPPRSKQSDRSSGARVSGAVIVVLGLLLALPGYSLSRLTAHFDWRVIVGLPLGMSVVAFFAYRSDKRRAEAGEWRIPEATLQGIALLGGWPGAFLAQRVFRHKTSKVSFQFGFWLVVFLHQFAALDALLDWRLTRDALHAMRARAA